MEGFLCVSSGIAYKGAQTQVFYSLGGWGGLVIPSLLFYFAYLLHQSELSYIQMSGLRLSQKKCITRCHIFKNYPPFFSE